VRVEHIQQPSERVGGGAPTGQQDRQYVADQVFLTQATLHRRGAAMSASIRRAGFRLNHDLFCVGVRKKCRTPRADHVLPIKCRGSGALTKAKTERRAAAQAKGANDENRLAVAILILMAGSNCALANQLQHGLC